MSQTLVGKLLSALAGCEIIPSMRSFLECIPCMFSQAVRCGRLVGLDDETIRELVNDTARAVPHVDPTLPPPVNAHVVYRRLAALAGTDDPFAEVKRRHTELALRLLPALCDQVEHSADRLDAAVRLAAAGNTLDLGALDEPDDLEALPRRALEVEHARWDIGALHSAVAGARTVLVVGDNAGETVFDRVLLEIVRELLPRAELFVSARGAPIINDATVADAEAAGLDRVATVVSTGSGVPGVVLGDVSAEFRDLLLSVDLVLAKGQGNYETMSEIPREVFFILTAKCRVVARQLGLPLGSSVLLHHCG